MALSGTYTKITKTLSETETTTVEYTYPSVLPSDSPDYELRGTTVETVISASVITEEPIENTYLVVTGTTIEKEVETYALAYAYRVFASREDNSTIDIQTDEYLYSSSDRVNWTDELPTNPIETAYELLKAQPQCANMINA